MPQEPGRGLDERLAAFDPLHDPVRRSLYLYVAAQPHEVSRDEAAEAASIQRTLAAFHLDRLAEAGLLEVSYRRLSGRRGPGAGRPAKLHRRSSHHHDMSLPPHDYRLAAELLAQAVEEQGGPRLRQVGRSAFHDVARRFGRDLGHRIRARLGRRTSRRRQMETLGEALAAQGYEPYREGDDIRLRNCPFHDLAEAHRELVCGMNLALVEGVVDGLQATHRQPRLEPRPDQCCVAIGPVRQEGAQSSSSKAVRAKKATAPTRASARPVSSGREGQGKGESNGQA